MARVLFLVESASQRIRAEVTRARGNEVCFVAKVAEGGEVSDPRVVARGHRSAVLAAVRDAKPGSLVIHNHPSGALDPSDPDLQVAAELHALGIGLAITDNQARELYVVVEPAAKKENKPLDGDAIDALLGPGGPVSRSHAAYEDRPMQRDMARAVAGAYNGGGTLLAEAGTGTGKSVAYLIPAIRWAMQNGERTVVSTNTINLQEQLVGKDLPFLRKALGEPFRYALVKGRRNYVSIRRAKLAVQSAGLLLDDGGRSELDSIASWLKQTREGSLQDLPFTPSPDVWDEVASESDVCLRAKCPSFDQCFYQRARRDSAGADVLVVNHHLLFSDLAVRRAAGNYTAPAVLPPYRRVVLDEAHNLEDAATSHLGANVSRRGLQRVLGRLDRRGRGVLRAVEERLEAGKDDLLQQDALRQIGEQLRPRVERARQLTGELFGSLERLLMSAEDGVLRLPEGFAASDVWTAGMQPTYADLLLVLEELSRGLDKLRERILLDSRWTEALEEQLVELQGAAGRVRGGLDSLRVALQPTRESSELVRWLERRGGGMREPNIAVRAAPVDLAEAMRDALFDRVDTAVLTSATLATRKGFDFVRQRLGLAGGGIKLEEIVYPSPFDFDTQTVVAIPTDLPSPRGVGSEHFDARTAEVVRDVAEASDGGVFALFTSYRALTAVAAELRRRGAEASWPLYVQGEAPRANLIQRFTESGRAILLGVASFWEGVDVPGEPLRGLVIAKLPFRVPSEPLTQARIEAVEAEGGNSFYDYMLPHAALRLKQGFGRLIRAKTDRGAIVLLDRRLLDRSYGKYFLDSLPPAPVRTAPWQELRAGLVEFYGTVGGEAGVAAHAGGESSARID